MQISSLNIRENGTFEISAINNQTLVTMCGDADPRILCLQTHLIIWVPQNNLNIAYVDTETQLKLSEKGIRSFVKDGQEFTIEGLSDEKFVHLVQGIHEVAKKALTETKTSDILKPSKKSFVKKSSTHIDLSSSPLKAKVNYDSIKQIFVFQNRAIIHRLIISLFRQIGDEVIKKIKRDKEIKEEHQRIDHIKDSREILQKQILTQQISEKEIIKAAAYPILVS